LRPVEAPPSQIVEKGLARQELADCSVERIKQLQQGVKQKGVVMA
jgi:hypothetical protein